MKSGVLIVVMVSVLLSGCDNMAPKCNDPETIDLVTQIADGEMAKTVGREAANLFTYELTGIRTTGVNEEIGSYECAADLQMMTKERGNHSGSITYTVENTDDGEEFYVNVFGL